MEQFKNVAAMNVQVGRGFLIEKVFFLEIRSQAFYFKDLRVANED